MKALGLVTTSNLTPPNATVKVTNIAFSAATATTTRRNQNLTDANTSTTVPSMREYSKIETLFERNEDFTVNVAKLKHPVLASINPWVVTEKVDGTNIRVHLNADNSLSIGGRTANAQLPAGLVENIWRDIPPTSIVGLRQDADPVTITLYGEGYGAGIQKGGSYRADKAFILFDVLIGGRWWLPDKAVSEIAEKLRVPRAPVLGMMHLDEIVYLVRKGFHSTLPGATCAAEGIVARPLEPLFDSRGNRLIIKLKTKDFVGGKR